MDRIISQTSSLFVGLFSERDCLLHPHPHVVTVTWDLVCLLQVFWRDEDVGTGQYGCWQGSKSTMDRGLRVLLSTVLCLSNTLLISCSCKFDVLSPPLLFTPIFQ